MLLLEPSEGVCPKCAAPLVWERAEWAENEPFRAVGFDPMCSHHPWHTTQLSTPAMADREVA